MNPYFDHKESYDIDADYNTRVSNLTDLSAMKKENADDSITPLENQEVVIEVDGE